MRWMIVALVALTIGAGPVTQPANTHPNSLRLEGIPDEATLSKRVDDAHAAVESAKRDALAKLEATAAYKAAVADAKTKETELETARDSGTPQDRIAASSACNKARKVIADMRAGAIKQPAVNNAMVAEDEARAALSKVKEGSDAAARDAERKNRVVFVLDTSGSMINKMATVKDEVRSWISQLPKDSTFNLVYEEEEKPKAIFPKAVASTDNSRDSAGKELEGVTATGTGHFTNSVAAAIAMNPGTVWLISDSIEPKQVTAIRKINAIAKVRINAVFFIENKAERQKNADIEGLMKQIATENSGDFRCVEMDNIH